MGILRRSKQGTDAFLLARPAGSLSNFKESSKRACLQASLEVTIVRCKQRYFESVLLAFHEVFGFDYSRCRMQSELIF
jgi:hypothetical protein